MIYRVGIDKIERQHWVAFVLDLPGCFSAGKSRVEAEKGLGDAIDNYLIWRDGFLHETADDQTKFEIVQVHEANSVDDQYFINAFFEDDKRVVTPEDADHIAWLLECTRNDLLAVIQTADASQLERPVHGEIRENIMGVLNHIATAELWYLEALDLAFHRNELVTDVRERLSQVRSHLLIQLPLMVNSDLICERRQELWSARKIVRRALWHERAHTQQIERYMRND